MGNFEKTLELAANFAELAAGIVIIFSVIKIWPVFNNLANAREPKQDLADSFHSIHLGLSKILPCEEISNISEAVDQILSVCWHHGSSDIHIDLHPQGDEIKGRIRFRRDGVMQTVCWYQEVAHRPLTMKLRELAGIAIDPPAAASGRIQTEIDAGRLVGFLIGIVPANLGEAITIRVLDPDSVSLDWEVLGIPDQGLADLKHTLEQPRGMIVYAGPIGSGKTVSLYTSIDSLDTDSRKIMTIEDPMEIDLPDVTQLPVLDTPGHRFPELFDAAMRSDVDVLMIGEIKDETTASYCSRAHNNMTLVLTTMSSHSVIDTLERLYRLNQDVDFYNLLLMNQSLARRLCKGCSQPGELSSQDQQFVSKVCAFNQEDFNALPSMLKTPVGCDICEDGYRGRVGAYELLNVTAEMLQALRDGASTRQLWQMAIDSGTRTCHYDLVTKAGRGETTLDEVHRVMDYSYYDYG